MQKTPPSDPPPGSSPGTTLGLLRFWREATVVGALASVLALGVGLALPAEYLSESVVLVKRGKPRDALPEALEASVRELASSTAVLTMLAHRVEGEETLERAVEVAKAGVSVSSLGGGRFRVGFRTSSAELSQHGCQDLTQAVVEGVPRLAKIDASERAREEQLNQRTRDLALFVAAHPDLVAEAPAPSPSEAKKPVESAGAAAAADPTLLVLREEKKRIETELSAQRLAAPAPSSVFGPNPYEEPEDSAAVDKLQKRLGELRLAIFAHQRALAAREPSTPSQKPVVRPAADPALQGDWRKLVQGVVEAQQALRRAEVTPLDATILEPPTLPSSPVKPSRPLIGLVALVVGLWGSLTWSLFRRQRVLGRRAARQAMAAPPRVASAAPPERDAAAAGLPAVGGTGSEGETSAFAATVAVPAPQSVSEPPRTPRVQSDPPPMPAADAPRPSSSHPPPRPSPKSDPPRPTGAEAPLSVRETLRPPRGASTPPPPGPWPSKDELTRPSSPPGPRRTISPPPVQPRDDAPNTSRVGSPEAASRGPSTLPHGSRAEPRPDTTYSIVDRSRRSSKKPEPQGDLRLSARGTRPLVTDEGVLRPGSDPPGVIGYDARPPPAPRGGTRPGWAIPSPPPIAAKAELVRTVTPPPRDAEVVRPHAVPPSWRPPPPSPRPALEVEQLRDQLLGQRTGKCFVLGVVGEAEALEAKSLLAVRLAMMLADSGARVLVLEANFDFPAVARVMNLDMPRLSGFSQQVHARIRSGHREPWTVLRCTPNLHVLAEGFMRSPGVSLSREFADAISELRLGYDFIIADGPAASASADCKPLNAFTDGLVVAVRPGAKLSDAIDHAARWFSRKDLMAAVYFEAK